eukprot:GEMP01018391.1.p1 GENE.GEMP01018391.1~~GEMP01018391.1.p1  ORF type:complete len:685 (+),score=150.75 GEMP01018391.1:178-2232(+)
MMEPSEFMGDLDGFQDRYLWLMILGGIIAFIMAAGIGANDVANSFATPVASKTISYKKAMALSVVFEITGAVGLGAAVTDTVRKKIVDLDYFKYNPEVLMAAMLASLTAAGSILLVATRMGYPVSCTHLTVGALVGVGIVTSPESVNWDKLGLVVISWISAPGLSAFMSFTIFCGVRKFILRHPDGGKRALFVYPFLLTFLCVTVMLFILFKNPQVDLKKWRKDNPWYTVLIAFGAGFVIALVTYLASRPYVARSVRRAEDLDTEMKMGQNQNVSPQPNDEELVNIAMNDPIDVGSGQGPAPPSASKGGLAIKNVLDDDAELGSKNRNPLGFLHFGHVKLADEIVQNDATVKQIHDEAETFPESVEQSFCVLQVIAACFDSLAHGSSDIANAAAPFATLLMVYQNAEANKKIDVSPWILLAGGIAMALGLLSFGYYIIQTLGFRLMKMTASRGFAIEMASSWVLIVGSNIGIPLAGTHCQVGATFGVGLCERTNGKRGLNIWLAAKIVLSWAVSLFVSGVLAIGIYSVISVSYFPRSSRLSCGNLPIVLQSYHNSTGTSFNIHDAYSSGTLEAMQTALEGEFEALDTNNDSFVSGTELVTGSRGTAKDVDTWAKEDDVVGLKLKEWYAWRCATKTLDTFDRPCIPLCAVAGQSGVNVECTWTKELGDQQQVSLLAKYETPGACH